MKTKISLKSENKKLIAVIIISVIVILSVIMIRFGDNLFDPDRPQGVGFIGSEHIHARAKIFLIDATIELDPKSYPKYESANDYIFFDRNGNVHRVATGANLGMFFESLGIKYADNCIFLMEDTFFANRTMIKQKEFCEDDYMKLALFVNNQFTDNDEHYVIQEGDIAILMYIPEDNPNFRSP